MKTASQSTRAVATSEPRTSPALVRATGRDRADWFAELDSWGAAGREYREIHNWLTTDHQVSSWWAQKLIVEYEQWRGLRPPGVRRDGTFSVTASKTINVPVDRLFEGLLDPKLRDRWLRGVALRERGSQAGRSVRFDREDDGSRVTVTFAETASRATQVAIENERLADEKAASKAKAYWRERLAALEGILGKR